MHTAINWFSAGHTFNHFLIFCDLNPDISRQRKTNKDIPRLLWDCDIVSSCPISVSSIPVGKPRCTLDLVHCRTSPEFLRRLSRAPDEDLFPATPSDQEWLLVWDTKRHREFLFVFWNRKERFISWAAHSQDFGEFDFTDLLSIFNSGDYPLGVAVC